MNETFPPPYSEEAVPLSIKGLSERGGERRFTHTEVDEGEEETFDLLSTGGLDEVRTLTKEAFMAQELVRDRYTAFDFRVLEDVYLRLQEALDTQSRYIVEGDLVEATAYAPLIQTDIKNFIELLELHTEGVEEEEVAEAEEIFEEQDSAPLSPEATVAVFVERYPGGFAGFERDFDAFVGAVDPSGQRDTRSSFHALSPLSIHDIREMTSPWNESDKDNFLAEHQLTHEDIEPWFSALLVWSNLLQDIDEAEERFDTIARMAFIEHVKRTV